MVCDDGEKVWSVMMGRCGLMGEGEGVVCDAGKN